MLALAFLCSTAVVPAPFPCVMRCSDGLDSRATVPESEFNESSFDFKCGGTTPSSTVSVSDTTDRAMHMHTTAAGRKMGQCAGWVQEARDSLRGRRLFTLLAVVNLVNYLDRGVRDCRVECGLLPKSGAAIS